MRSWRRLVEIVQAILIFGLPFLKINNESALRFDIPALRLYFFGAAIWMQEFFVVLIACIFLALFTIFITLIFGRVWCGWLCPQTVLTDLLPFAEKKSFFSKVIGYLITFFASALIAVSLIWYFISPYEFIPDLLRGDLSAIKWGFWIVLTLLAFLNYAFLRHEFCATICPYAKLQSVLFDPNTLIIELDPARAAECIACSGCVRACPTGVDIRKGLNAACINCAECIDACGRVMAGQGKKGLVHYAFGTGGEGRILRQNFYVAGGAVLFFLILTVYAAVGRTGIDFTVLPYNMGPYYAKDGRVINAYVLAVKNMQHNPVDLDVTVEKFDETVTQSINSPVHLGAGTSDKLPLFVRSGDKPDIRGSRKIRITLTNRADGKSVVSETNFIIPDKTD
jgi:polyferredoxin